MRSTLQQKNYAFVFLDAFGYTSVWRRALSCDVSDSGARGRSTARSRWTVSERRRVTTRMVSISGVPFADSLCWYWFGVDSWITRIRSEYSGRRAIGMRWEVIKQSDALCLWRAYMRFEVVPCCIQMRTDALHLYIKWYASMCMKRNTVTIRETGKYTCFGWHLNDLCFHLENLLFSFERYLQFM